MIKNSERCEKLELTHVAIVLYLDKTRAKYRNGVQTSSPRAQIRGSARGFIFLYLRDDSAPSPTPRKPAMTVIIPNVNATLKFTFNKDYNYFIIFHNDQYQQTPQILHKTCEQYDNTCLPV
jgi:hypothetical protein